MRTHARPEISLRFIISHSGITAVLTVVPVIAKYKIFIVAQNNRFFSHAGHTPSLRCRNAHPEAPH